MPSPMTRLSYSSEFRIAGSLVAVGTESDSITFVSNADSPTEEDWSGITSFDPHVIHLSYVSFRHANQVFGGSSIVVSGEANDSLRITHSTFRDIDFHIFDTNIEIYSGGRCLIQDNRFDGFDSFSVAIVVRL